MADKKEKQAAAVASSASSSSVAAALTYEEKSKQLKDYSEEVKTRIPELEKQAEKDLNGALNELLLLEKKARLAVDMPSTLKLCLSALKLCRQYGSVDQLSTTLSLLFKRRAQMQKVMEAIIREAVSYVASLTNRTEKKSFISTLREMTVGKMFCEVERATVSCTLAAMQEDEGDIAAAAETLQEIQVETIGAMELNEKLHILLEQLRLTLTRNDAVRAELCMKKIDPKVFATTKGPLDETMTKLKLRYYRLIIQFHFQNHNYLDVCKAYRAIFDTPAIQLDDTMWKDVLARVVTWSILSPWDAEVNDFLHRLKLEDKLKHLPDFKHALDQYTSDEIMRWPLNNEAAWKECLTVVPIAVSKSSTTSSSSAPSTTSSLPAPSPSPDAPAAQAKRFADLHKRVVQHNLRVISLYYTRITMQRLSSLLQLDNEKSEEYLCEMVSDKQLTAKVDRPTGIVDFKPNKQHAATIQAWTRDINELLGLVDNSNHLIAKELMVHKLK